MNVLNVVTLPDRRRALIIRTSDRIAFKQCRRKWAWSSHLKQNLGSKHLAGPLWFGSAIHYALEDFHGYNQFGHPRDAFRAYCVATSKQHLRDLPGDAMELFGLGTAMMEYYVDHWLTRRKLDETYWEDGIPQVEVNFEIPVPLDENPHLAEYARALGADCVLYRGTIDRVAVDANGDLWIVEYKTAKRAEHLHYQTDPQVTTYVWAASHVYDRPIAGVVYLQFVKNLPEPPRILSTTGKISTASNLVTSAPLYEKALINFYGSIERATGAHQNFLTDLMRKEDENKDRFIQREYIFRSRRQCASEAQKILLELEDMLNPDLPLYPNPTRECSRMCSFVQPCVAFDRNEDWEGMLAEGFSARDQAPDRMWRRRLPDPTKLAAMREQNIIPDLEAMQVELQAMPEEQRNRVAEGEEEVSFTFSMQ
jgi:hypothetical protein